MTEQTDINISSIQNINESNANNSQSSNTTNFIDVKENENELRKRIYDDNNSSVIWSEFDLIKINKETNERIFITLQEIYNNPRQETNRMTHSDDFNKLIKNKNFIFKLKCRTCSSEYTFYPASKTSTIAIQHIKERHPEKFKYKDHVCKRPYSKITTSDKFINKGHILLSCFMITQLLSYHTLKNEYLSLFVDHLQNERIKYIVPSEDSMKEKIVPEMSKKVKEKIKEEIKSTKGICASLDGWTSKTDGSQFLSFTITYEKENKLVTRTLKLSQEFKSHKSFHIKEFIENVIEEYSLNDFIPFPLCTDNAPDVLASVRIAGLEEVGCICHRYELIIEEALENNELMKKLINKCEAISVKIKRSEEWKR